MYKMMKSNLENMSGFICSNCGRQIKLFGIEGGQKQAKRMNVSFMGALPIDIEAREMADIGKAVILTNVLAYISIAMADIVTKIERIFSELSCLFQLRFNWGKAGFQSDHVLP